MKYFAKALIVAGGMALLLLGGTASLHAQPEWLVGDVWVNNMCRTPSGNWWLYPIANAQPVGTACSVPHYGPWGVWWEPGTVTPQ